MKTRMVGLLEAEKRLRMYLFIPFNKIDERDRETNGYRATHGIGIIRAVHSVVHQKWLLKCLQPDRKKY